MFDSVFCSLLVMEGLHSLPPLFKHSFLSTTMIVSFFSLHIESNYMTCSLTEPIFIGMYSYWDYVVSSCLILSNLILFSS